MPFGGGGDATAIEFPQVTARDINPKKFTSTFNKVRQAGITTPFGSARSGLRFIDRPGFNKKQTRLQNKISRLESRLGRGARRSGGGQPKASGFQAVTFDQLHDVFKGQDSRGRNQLLTNVFGSQSGGNVTPGMRQSGTQGLKRITGLDASDFTDAGGGAFQDQLMFVPAEFLGGNGGAVSDRDARLLEKIDGLKNQLGGMSRPKKIFTDLRLSPLLQRANKTAQQGLGTNLDFLNIDPNQRFTFIDSGRDPLFNILRDQALKEEQLARGRAQVNATSSGNLNSTAFGGLLGTIANDAVRRRNEDIIRALEFGDTQARNNVGTQLSTIGSLANLIYPLGTVTNQNLLTSMGARDAGSQFNVSNNLQSQIQNAANSLAAQQSNQGAALQAAQIEQQERLTNQARQQSFLGSLIGGIGTLALAPFSGGGSLGGGLASGLLGIGGGGGGSSISPASFGGSTNITTGLPLLSASQGRNFI